MDGSKLASGARTAAFNVEGAEEFTHDLKTLTREQFVERYDCTEQEYGGLCCLLETSCVDIKPLPRRGKSSVKVHGEAVEMPAPVKVKIVVPAKSEYKADALGDNVLVIRVEREHSSQLIIPESAKAKSDVGYVAAIGPDVRRCAKGELILFDRFAAHGKEIELMDEQGIARQHLLLNDCDVLLRLFKVMPKVESAPVSEPSQP